MKIGLIKGNKIKIGLIKGRHEIPQVERKYIFKEDIDPIDVDGAQLKAFNVLSEIKAKDPQTWLDIYVTGLTMALIATLNAARQLDLNVTLYHFDRETGKYFPQAVL